MARLGESWNILGTGDLNGQFQWIASSPKIICSTCAVPTLTLSTEQENSAAVRKVVLSLQRNITCAVSAMAMCARADKMNVPKI